MIDIPTSVKVLVVASAILIFAAGIINGEALRRHLLDHHEKVVRKLGYPPGITDFSRPEHDSQVATADWALWRFLWRREFNDLGDDRLRVLAERQLWLIRAGILLLFVFGVGLFVVS